MFFFTAASRYTLRHDATWFIFRINIVSGHVVMKQISYISCHVFFVKSDVFGPDSGEFVERCLASSGSWAWYLCRSFRGGH